MTTTPTTITVSGRLIALNPVFSKPWVQPDNCELTYNVDSTRLVALDFSNPRSIDSKALSCWPEDVTSDGHEGLYTTAFGPKVECPEVYSTVRTSVISKGTTQVLCCPSSYSLSATPLVENLGLTVCVSRATPGQVLSFYDREKSSSITSTIKDDTVAVFGQEVNGFNVAATVGAGDSDAGDDGGNGNESDSGTPVAVIVGVTVGLVCGLVVFALGLTLFLLRRKAGREHSVHGEVNSRAQELAVDGGRVTEQELALAKHHELPVHERDVELAENASSPVYELPGENELISGSGNPGAVELLEEVGLPDTGQQSIQETTRG